MRESKGLQVLARAAMNGLQSQLTPNFVKIAALERTLSVILQLLLIANILHAFSDNICILAAAINIDCSHLDSSHDTFKAS